MNSEDLKKIREALEVATREISFDTITAAREALRLFDDHVASLSQQEAEPMPSGHLYEFVSPISGDTVWRSTCEKWNDQQALSSRPYYFHPPKPAPLPQPVASEWPKWAAGHPYLPKLTEEVLDMVPADEPVVLIENGDWTQAAVDFVAVIPVFPSVAEQQVSSVSQGLEEFIAEKSFAGSYHEGDVITVSDFRTWMAGHARAPVEPTIKTQMKIDCIGEFSWQEDAPYYDDKGEVHDYVATHVVPWDVCKDIFKRMYKSMIAASQEGV